MIEEKRPEHRTTPCHSSREVRKSELERKSHQACHAYFFGDESSFITFVKAVSQSRNARQLHRSIIGNNTRKNEKPVISQASHR